jgi:hypothetical protein
LSILSHVRQVNFSRTVWITFHWRGTIQSGNALPWSAGPVEIGTRSVAAPSSRQLHLALAGILTRNLSLASDSASYCVTEVMANSEHDPAGQNPPHRTDEITSLEQ